MPQALVNAWYARKAQEAANKRVKKISCGRDSIAARALNNSLVVSRSVVGGALASSGRSANQKYVLMRYPTSRPLQPIRKDLVIRFRRQRLAREAIMAAKEISVKKYVVRLSGEERERLETLLRKGKSPARRVLKA